MYSLEKEALAFSCALQHRLALLLCRINAHFLQCMHCRRAVESAPGHPSHALNYMHALEILQRYGQVLFVARDLLQKTRCHKPSFPSADNSISSVRCNHHLCAGFASTFTEYLAFHGMFASKGMIARTCDLLRDQIHPCRGLAACQ